MTENEQPAAGVALKACPLCSSDDVVLHRVTTDGGWGVMCRGCHTYQDTRSPEPETAVNAWNRRPAPTDAGGAVSEAADLRQALDLALIRLGRMEPGDSRAVSDEYVAMAAAGTPHHNDEGRAIIGRAILIEGEAALTPAPQAEGEALAGQAYINAIKDHRTLFGTNLKTAREAVDNGWRPKAPQPLQQGGEVTREQVARVVAADIARQDSLAADVTPENVTFDQGLEWDYIDQGLVDFGQTADAILALFAALAADRDKAVGLLREVREHVLSVRDHDTLERLDAFLSSQTEGS